MKKKTNTFEFLNFLNRKQKIANTIEKCSIVETSMVIEDSTLNGTFEI